MLQEVMFSAFLKPVLIFLAVTAVISVFILATKQLINKPKEETPAKEKMPYLLKGSVLTQAEFAFSGELVKYTAKDSIVLTKVSLHDVFDVDRSVAGKDYFGYLNRFRQKHVDFLICDRITFKPLYGVELDDSSHNTQKAQKRDEFVNSLYNHVGLPLIHIRWKRQYTPQDFMEIMKVNDALSRARI